MNITQQRYVFLYVIICIFGFLCCGNYGKTNSIHAMKNMNDFNIEINDCHKKIKQIYLKANVKMPKQNFFKPGYKLFHQKMLNAIVEKEYVLTLGSVYNLLMTPFGFVNYYYLVSHISSGDIVILHNKSWTINMIDDLGKWLKQKNVISVKLDDMF
jgi:hypothetical protein